MSHIVVDTVQTKDEDSVHVMFVASVEGIIRKLVIIPGTKETCLIEQIKVFPDDSDDAIKVLKILKDTVSIHICMYTTSSMVNNFNFTSD